MKISPWLMTISTEHKPKERDAKKTQTLGPIVSKSVFCQDLNYILIKEKIMYQLKTPARANAHQMTIYSQPKLDFRLLI